MTEGKSFAALLASYVLQGSIAPVLVSRVLKFAARVSNMALNRPKSLN
jgi:hypothetical protein